MFPRYIHEIIGLFIGAEKKLPNLHGICCNNYQI